MRLNNQVIDTMPAKATGISQNDETPLTSNHPPAADVATISRMDSDQWAQRFLSKSPPQFMIVQIINKIIVVCS